MRLYAEDPQTFLPQAGRIERLRLPASVRVDAGVEEGDEIGTGYDPMIAKLIATGDTRDEALDRLAAALASTEVAGVTTNLPFLRWLVAHPVLRAGEATTAFLAEYPPLSAPPARLPDPVWRGGFRLNLPAAAVQPPPDVDAAGHEHGPGEESSNVVAPMPGTVIKVLVAAGDQVAAREPLVVLEAMKMETPLLPVRRDVAAVHVAKGIAWPGGAARRTGVRHRRCRTPRASEELLELHGGAQVAFDLQLARHVGRRRVLFARDDLVERLAGRGDRRVGVAAAFCDAELPVGNRDEPLALVFDVEEVRVRHSRQLRRVGARLEAVEEILGRHDANRT